MRCGCCRCDRLACRCSRRCWRCFSRCFGGRGGWCSLGCCWRRCCLIRCWGRSSFGWRRCLGDWITWCCLLCNKRCGQCKQQDWCCKLYYIGLDRHTKLRQVSDQKPRPLNDPLLSNLIHDSGGEIRPLCRLFRTFDPKIWSVFRQFVGEQPPILAPDTRFARPHRDRPVPRPHPTAD